MALVEAPVSTLSEGEFENAMSRIIPQPKELTPHRYPLSETVYDQIRTALELAGKLEWSKRPRTYAILFLIDRINAMDAFVDQELFDIEIPYSRTRLASVLGDQSSSEGFLANQSIALTKATGLENGKHRHFASGAAADSCFILREALGKGRTGIVDHVVSKLSLREYARKRIQRNAFPRGQHATKSFEKEIDLLKQFSHHHIVKFAGSYTDPEFVGLLITPVAESDLKTFLETKPLRQAFILRHAFGCLCAAIQYLHSHNIRHKDIKPANILLKNGEVFITDFGTARNWAIGEGGTTVGKPGPYTPAYAAPEVVDYEARNEAADIWSLGCVYLDMITVLKGEDLEGRTAFFKSHGSGNLNPRTNHGAFVLWLARLRSLNSIHNEPIQWTRSMVRTGPRQRITAFELLRCIREHRDCDNDIVYYGHCCVGGEVDLSSICPSSVTLRSGGSHIAKGAEKHIRTGVSGSQGELTSTSASGKADEWIDCAPSKEQGRSKSSEGVRSPRKTRRTASAQWSALGSFDSFKPSTSRRSHRVIVPKMDCRQNFEETSESETETFAGVTNGSFIEEPKSRQSLWYDQLHMRLAFCHSSDEREPKSNLSSSDNELANKHIDLLCEKNTQLWEKRFRFYRIEVTPMRLCQWILHNCSQHYSSKADGIHTVNLLCTSLLTFSFAFASAGECALDLLSGDRRESLIEFGRRGREIWRDLQRLLRKCDHILISRILKQDLPHGDLPNLSPLERETFIRMIVEPERQTLQSLIEDMCKWSDEFKTAWLGHVLDNQVPDVKDIQAVDYLAASKKPAENSEIRKIPHPDVKKPIPPSSPTNKSAPLPLGSRIGSRLLRSSFCISEDCELCVHFSESRGNNGSATRKIFHPTSDFEVIIHQEHTSISRDHVNTRALRETTFLSWYCGIRNRECFAYVRGKSNEDSAAFGRLYSRLRKCADTCQNIVIVPGRLSVTDVQELVSLTTDTRRARKLGRVDVVDKGGTCVQHADHIDHSLDQSSVARTTLDGRRINITREQMASRSMMHRKHTFRSLGPSNPSQIPSKRPGVSRSDPHQLPPARRIVRRRTHVDLRRSNSPENSLENTLRVVRKASAWFKKLAGGRKSAPPHEKAGSRGKAEWR